MQQQQQTAEEAARADCASLQALTEQVLQLHGETATIANTVPNITLDDPNTGTPDASCIPRQDCPMLQYLACFPRMLPYGNLSLA
ncbi:hypothetical protein Hamer_G003940 [Homarus americanus]|uniref:Uncharacterized protein n=1 Tax=Homarus americanus TaxID=6706 RepID=A0A8J5TM04_HOMAM|nr:hypothetical protein Hamer_G003940 [Homarus americanus]